MKIGILTHYYNSLNFGGMLQSYALVAYLKKKGYDAEQVSYAFSSAPFIKPDIKTDKVQKKHENIVLRLIKRVFRALRFRLIYKPREQFYSNYKKNEIAGRAESFAKFQNAVPHSEKAFNKENITAAAENYDCLITGSDQVWNFAWFNPAFFLDFQNCGAKRIAYAASAGKSVFCDDEKAYLKRTLKEFDAISVREADLVPTLNSITETDTTVQTVDPTLLLGAEDWNEIAAPRLVKEKYLFCYFLNNDENLSKLARKFAKKHKLVIATIPFPGIEYNAEDIKFGKYRFDAADPADFISLVKYADYVFTDSFHATVFSLLYGKQFLSFPRSDAKSMGSRLLTLTEMFGCKERFCCVEVEKRYDYILKLPPYEKNNCTEFEKVKQKSEEFLMKALKNN